jgi:hypothetical protein
MAISLASFFGVTGAAQAQTRGTVIEISWPAAEAPRQEPSRPRPAPLPAAAFEEPRLKAAAFTSSPAGQIPNVTNALGQRQPPRPKYSADGEPEFTVRTDLPGNDLLFRRESEDQMFDRIRLEAHTQPGGQRVTFPERVPVSREPWTPRQFPQAVERIEPSFVMHRRLLFEQKNFDRYGWELGALQPFISTGKFGYDVATLPYHWASRPLRRWDSSAGKCQPGDDTPLYLYREQLSAFGLAAQAGTVALGFLAFP